MALSLKSQLGSACTALLSANQRSLSLPWISISPPLNKDTVATLYVSHYYYSHQVKGQKQKVLDMLHVLGERSKQESADDATSKPQWPRHYPHLSTFTCQALSSALTKNSAPQCHNAACSSVSIRDVSTSRCAKSQKASPVFSSSHFQEPNEPAANDTPAWCSAADNSPALGSPSLSMLNSPW